MPTSDLDQQTNFPLVQRGPPRDSADLAMEYGSGLAIAVQDHPLPAQVVEVAGELDALTAPQLQEMLDALLRKACPTVVVDLSAVGFLGSAGLSVLVEVHQQAGSHTAVRIVAPGLATRRPLQATGLDTVLDVYQSLPDALASRPTPADR